MLSNRQISDRLEIFDLFSRYCRAVDTRDWDLLWSVFTKESVIDYTDAGGIRAKAGPAIDWLSSSLQSSAFSQHVVTIRDLDIQGQKAKSLSYYYNPTALYGRDDVHWSAMLVFGYYKDRLKRTKRGWRITDRRVEKVWQTPWWEQTRLPGAPLEASPRR
jgi:hypothetical protein